MANYDEALIQSFSRGVFALKPSLFRLFALAAVTSVSGYAEANLDYGVINYLLYGVMFLSFGLLIFEGARFGVVLFNKFGGWVSSAAVVATFMVGRFTVIAAESLNLAPILRVTSWPLIIMFGLILGNLIAALQKYDAPEAEQGTQPESKE